MFERLSNDEITNALDELIGCLGVSEEIPFHNLNAFLQKRATEECVQEIATRLGLPIRINLSYVPKGFRPGNTDGFRSSALARTDSTGHGIEGITAQVSIPQNLPMFGTPSLQGFPIRVRVSESCHALPDTFVAIMAHELSHVLLASLWSPHKDSELHTDLVPILLGFRDVIRRGRKNIESTTSGNTTTTHTTTYGYLTDEQFDFACDYVTDILKHHKYDKERILIVAEQLQRKLSKVSRNLATFRDYFSYLDIHPVEKMKKEHAQRVVQLHGHDYSHMWENRIAAVKKSIENAEAFARQLNHYKTSSIENLKTHDQVLELASKELNHVTEAITKDKRILRRYVGFMYRLQRTLWRHS
jgi:hypothetical protein